MSRRVRGLRWWITALLFLASLINFLNRLIIAILGPVITVQLGLTNAQFATLTTSFLIAYTASQGFSGKLYDSVGVKRGFLISVIIWSLASIAQAFARGLVSLDAFRCLLGVGEGGSWPGAAKVVADWLPVKERALGMGIFNSGTSLATVIAPPLIIGIELRFGWRATFFLVGGLGFVWLALWQWFYQPPEKHTRITSEEYVIIQQDRRPQATLESILWKNLLRYREVWSIVLSRFFADPVWWLYVTWLPLYLYKVRHFSLQQIGLFAWVPFVAADAGSLFGGWLSGYLIGIGWSVNKARKSIILASMFLMCFGIPAVMVKSSITALGLIAVVMFGFQSWISNVQTLPSDYFPEAAVGSVTGMGGVGAGLGAILFTQTTGFVVDHYSYTPILITAALLPIFATLVLFKLGGRIRPISIGSAI